jgi:hypothetical protein
LIKGIAQTMGTVAADLERAGERMVHGLESLAEAQARPAGAPALPPPGVSGLTGRARSPLTSGVLVGMPGTAPSVGTESEASHAAENVRVSAALAPATR